jgi:hypothetical protein
MRAQTIYMDYVKEIGTSLVSSVIPQAAWSFRVDPPKHRAPEEK